MIFRVTLFTVALTLAPSAFAMQPTKTAKTTESCKTKTYGNVEFDKMKEIVTAKEATIFDVNSKKSYKAGHIPGAVYFTKTNLKKNLPKDKDALIVAYCGGKKCGAWKKAAVAACKMGYKNVVHFSEGINGWKKSTDMIEI